MGSWKPRAQTPSHLLMASTSSVYGANTELLTKLTDYAPDTSVETGVAAFVAWYRDYYNV